MYSFCSHPDYLPNFIVEFYELYFFFLFGIYDYADKMYTVSLCFD